MTFGKIETSPTRIDTTTKDRSPVLAMTFGEIETSPTKIDTITKDRSPQFWRIMMIRKILESQKICTQPLEI